jgi:hypothetical protein
MTNFLSVRSFSSFEVGASDKFLLSLANHSRHAPANLAAASCLAPSTLLITGEGLHCRKDQQ